MADKEIKRDKYDIELPASIIESFARFLIPEIRKYYDSEQGQQEFGLYNKSWGKEQKRRTKQAQSGKMEVQESTT